MRSDLHARAMSSRVNGNDLTHLLYRLFTIFAMLVDSVDCLLGGLLHDTSM